MSGEKEMGKEKAPGRTRAGQSSRRETLPSGTLRATAVEAKRERVWELHLRGVPKSRIARECDLNRSTVASLIAECYAEVQGERVGDLRARLAGAVARMRRVQVQAWADHDAADQSQRSQYLRVILDAEKEIARLEGLYESLVDDSGAVAFRIELAGQSGLTVTTARQAAIVAPQPAGGE